MKLIKYKDVKWEKLNTYYVKDGEQVINEDCLYVQGIVGETNIGHYMTGRDEKIEVSCCVRFEEGDGESLFINKTYSFPEGENPDDTFFRERIVNVYNSYIRISECFE